jgi:hypothetical protein
MGTGMQKMFGVFIILFAGAAQGASLTLDALESGWISEREGINYFPNVPTSENYIVGQSLNTEWRNWFVFDLLGVTDEITSATLQLFNPLDTGYVSVDASETYEIFSYESSVSDLRLENGSGDFDDLGDGISYGQVVISAQDNGTLVEIQLNQAGITALNSASGEFAMGGLVTTLGFGSGDQERVFGGTDAGMTRQLELTLVPIPAAVWLFGSALAGLGWLRRKQTS